MSSTHSCWMQKHNSLFGWNVENCSHHNIKDVTGTRMLLVFSRVVSDYKTPTGIHVMKNEIWELQLGERFWWEAIFGAVRPLGSLYEILLCMKTIKICEHDPVLQYQVCLFACALLHTISVFYGRDGRVLHFITRHIEPLKHTQGLLCA